MSNIVYHLVSNSLSFTFFQSIGIIEKGNFCQFFCQTLSGSVRKRLTINTSSKHFVDLKACFSLMSKLVHNFWQWEKTCLNPKNKEKSSLRRVIIPHSHSSRTKRSTHIRKFNKGGNCKLQFPLILNNPKIVCSISFCLNESVEKNLSWNLFF